MRNLKNNTIGKGIKSDIYNSFSNCAFHAVIVIFIALVTTPLFASQCVSALGDLDKNGCIDLEDLNVYLSIIRNQTPYDASSDLNGDGFINISDARYLTTLFSNPRGEACHLAFSQPISFDVGDHPILVDSGDLNMDGSIDVVTANVDSGDLSILLGKGDGTFQPDRRLDIRVEDYNTGLANGLPLSLKIIDLNNDNKLDITTHIYYEGHGHLIVFMGNGDSTFTKLTTIQTGTDPTDLFLVKDISGDNIPDMVTSDDDSHSLHIHHGNGDGTFSFIENIDVSLPAPMSITAEDFNKDGYIDLLPVSYSYGYIPNDAEILLADNSSGNGYKLAMPFFVGFTNPYPWINKSVSITSADINGDSYADVVATTSDAAISVFLGSGDGFLRAGSRFSSDHPHSVVLSDINIDGKLDVVLTGNWGIGGPQDEGVVNILLGDGQGRFSPPSYLFIGDDSSMQSIADINSDCRPDIITTDKNANAISVFMNTN